MQLARLMAQEAAKVLRIAVPQIRFFYRPTGERMMAFYNADGIHIAGDLSDLELLRATVHEMRHAWQRQSQVWRYRSSALREQDAKIFELSWPR